MLLRTMGDASAIDATTAPSVRRYLPGKMVIDTMPLLPQPTMPAPALAPAPAAVGAVAVPPDQDPSVLANRRRIMTKRLLTLGAAATGGAILVNLLRRD